MANILSTEKQATVIGALAEGNSIRSIERMTGIHRDTIMRLGVRVGQGCEKLMDAKMRGLQCGRIECDEIWGFVGKKRKNASATDRRAGLGEQRRYSPAQLVSVFKTAINGVPNPDFVCTSYIERSNLTLRTHCKRLARLTLAFSKKLENFKAAIGLHLAYYNFVKTHGTIRCTPAMAAGVERSSLSIMDLVDAA